METNPYQSPAVKAQGDDNDVRPLACPECGEQMQHGYLMTSNELYWRSWNDKSWLVWKKEFLAGTRPAFVGSNKLSGYRCASCELIVFRHGMQKNSYRPE